MNAPKSLQLIRWNPKRPFVKKKCMTRAWWICFLTWWALAAASTQIALSDSKIPSGQDVGARAQQYTWQKRYEALKRRFARKKKKSQIEDKTEEHQQGNDRKKESDENTD